MLRLALVFAIVALVAGLFGFGLVANLAFDVAKLLFVVFLILAVVSLAFCYRRRPLDEF